MLSKESLESVAEAVSDLQIYELTGRHKLQGASNFEELERILSGSNLSK